METIILIISLLLAIFLFYIGYVLGKIVKDQEWIDMLPKIRQDSIKKSREVLSGQFSEQLAPFLPNFSYSPTECRFIGKPIDFIVFARRINAEPEEIIFVEVKSGKSKLSTTERKLRDIIKEKKIRWEVYRVNR